MAGRLDRLGRAARHRWRVIAARVLVVAAVVGAAIADNLARVVDGLGTTARVITSAAPIMISVFLGFVASPEPTVKMFGLGLAVAVLVDATVVRLVLVPATMEPLGDANWWLPRWLGHVLPRITIEEGPVPTPVLQGATVADA